MTKYKYYSEIMFMKIEKIIIFLRNFKNKELDRTKNVIDTLFYKFRPKIKNN